MIPEIVVNIDQFIKKRKGLIQDKFSYINSFKI